MKLCLDPDQPDAAAVLFAPRNDLSLMIQLFKVGGDSREEALRLADESCRKYHERNEAREQSK